MPPEFTLLDFGFNLLGQLTWFGAYGGAPPPTPTTPLFRPLGGSGGGPDDRRVFKGPPVVAFGNELPEVSMTLEMIQSLFRHHR